jgi:hypothetical protein
MYEKTYKFSTNSAHDLRARSKAWQDIKGKDMTANKKEAEDKKVCTALLINRHRHCLFSYYLCL